MATKKLSSDPHVSRSMSELLVLRLARFSREICLFIIYINFLEYSVPSEHHIHNSGSLHRGSQIALHNFNDLDRYDELYKNDFSTYVPRCLAERQWNMSL